VILVVAFSARMLAELAVRGGHEVMAVDHFGDLDLERTCANVSVAGPMAALVDAAEEIPAERVVYGAGLENRPDLVERLATGRKLLGCSPESLRRVRDPEQLAAAGLPYPRTFVGRPPPRRDGRWLRKPLRSGGGRGVRAWRGGVVGDGDVVQERITGMPCSAAAVADGRSAVVLGLTEQLTGRAEFGARGFTWCGNISPPRLSEEQSRVLADAADVICRRIAEAFGLRGLFGVDAVERDGVPWPVEVNPRYTASVEVLERGLGVPLLVLHRAVFEHQPVPVMPANQRGAMWGKAIYYAPHDLVVPDDGPWMKALEQPIDEAAYADLPHPGEVIERGRPVLTCFAAGRDESDCTTRLREMAAALDRHLGGR
jgi:uncharacterized protein